MMQRFSTLALVLVFVPVLSASAQSPILPVQGTLREMAGNLVNDTRSVTFRLYDQRTGGTPFYEVTKDVVFRNGQFVAYLGDQDQQTPDPPLPAADFDGLPTVYLGITISPETVEMDPRVRLGTSPFSLYSQLCGEAQSAALADSATNATSAATANRATTAGTADVANDLNCSGCVGAGDLADSVESQFAVRMHSHVLSDVTDRSNTVIPLAAVAAPELRSVPGGGTLCSIPPIAARFCALDRVDIRHSAGQAVGSRCYIQESNGNWQVCGTTFNEFNRLNCWMRCIE